MAMNFYREQEKARRQEKIMLLLFVVATCLLAMIFVQTLSLSVHLFFMVYGDNQSSGLSSPVLWTIAGVLIFCIMYASWRKLKQLSSGNYVATMTGSTRLTNNIRQQQIVNAVEEMAVSAGIPVPHIYVLENEPSVNAFAAGVRPADMTIGLTRGCLEYLNRDELQGIVAYQMAQIINGYARLNSLIYSTLFGLEALHNMLADLMKDSAKSGDPRVWWLIVSIFPVWAMGYLGHFFSKIIKSIICRENVFKADATAVQLTRNPNGIASVLQKSLHTKWSYILFADGFLLDLEHLLFTFGNNPIYEFQILHTHPDTRERIKKILPHWRGTPIATEDAPCPSQETPFYNQTKVKNVLGASERSWQKTVENEEIKIIPTLSQNHEVAYDAVATAAALGIIGGINDMALIKGEVKDEAYWFIAARQPETASAVVVAMLSRHSDNKKACLDIAELFNKELHNNIKHLLEHALPDDKRFAVLAIALPNVRLNIVGEENINKYKQFLQQVIKSDDKITLFEHCVYAAVSGCLKTSLMAGFLPSVAKDKLKHEIIELLNLTAQHSNSGRHAEKAFQAALTECGFAQTAYRDNIPLGRLSSLLQSLDRLSMGDKHLLLNAIKNIANFDGNMAHSEKDWLSALTIAWEVHV